MEIPLDKHLWRLAKRKNLTKKEGYVTMRTTFLPFHIPWVDEAEIQEVVDSLRSGWLTTGPKVKEFEEQFAWCQTGAV